MSESNCNEVWQMIEGFPNYEVSDAGRVRSWVGCRKYPHVRRETPVLLNAITDRDGYRCVNLCRDGKRQRFFVHRLVASAFHGHPAKGQNQIRHLDGVKSNNVPSNLAWGNGRENYDDRKLHGTGNEGERSHHAKFTNGQASDIVRLHGNGWSVDHIADQYGVCKETIHRLVRGKTYVGASAPRAVWGN